MKTVYMEPYKCVSGTPYVCEVPGCKERACWRYNLPQKTVLYCNTHKERDEDVRSKYGFNKDEESNG